MPLRERAGFSFIELIVGLAIMLTIATVVTPVLLSTLDRARIDAAKASLQGFSDAIDAFENDVKEHPGYLHQLQKEITVHPDSANLCGNLFKNGTGKGGTDTWVGPYLDRVIPSNGQVPVGVGIALDALSRSGSQNRAGELTVTILQVSLEDAQALDLLLDGQDGPTGGTIRWPATATTGPLTMQYVKPSPRC